MTSDEYQDGRRYELEVLRDVRESVQSIEGCVDEILEELRDHVDLHEKQHWGGRSEFYDHGDYAP
jgi:hypothetical protein